MFNPFPPRPSSAPPPVIERDDIDVTRMWAHIATIEILAGGQTSEILLLLNLPKIDAPVPDRLTTERIVVTIRQAMPELWHRLGSDVFGTPMRIGDWVFTVGAPAVTAPGIH